MYIYIYIEREREGGETTPEAASWTSTCERVALSAPLPPIDNLLVRIHFIIVLIRWIGLAPREADGQADLLC